MLRALVRKLQQHDCTQQSKCRKDSNGRPLPFGCRYCYPKPLLDEPTLSVESGRFDLPRFSEEDRTTVGYHPELLLRWQGHMDVQYCNSARTAAYVCKYISKGEPLLYGSKKFQSEVIKYFETRLLGSPEACTIFQGQRLFAQSRTSLYINTSRDRWRVLARDGHELLPGKIELYMERPAALENIALVPFYEQYEVLNHDLPERAEEHWLTQQSGRFVVRRRRNCVVTTNYICKKDHEYYRQHLIRFAPFRNEEALVATNLVGQFNLDCYKEECIRRGIIAKNEEIAYLEDLRGRFMEETIRTEALQLVNSGVITVKTVNTYFAKHGIAALPAEHFNTHKNANLCAPCTDLSSMEEHTLRSLAEKLLVTTHLHSTLTVGQVEALRQICKLRSWQRVAFDYIIGQLSFVV